MRTPIECARHMVVQYGTTDAPKHVADVIHNNRHNATAFAYWRAVDAALVALLLDMEG